MGKDKFGTEAEVRAEIDKLTTREVIQRLRCGLFNPNVDVRVINTEQLLVDRLEKDLELLEINKKQNNINDIPIMETKLETPKIELTLEGAFKVCADNGYAVVEHDYLDKLYDEIRDLRKMLKVMKYNIVLVNKVDNTNEVYNLEINPGCSILDEKEYELYKEWLKNDKKQL